MKNQDNDNVQSAAASQHEQLCALLLGELGAAEAAKLQAELEGSAELRAERDRLEATIGLLRDTCAESEVLPPQVVATIQRAAAPEAAPRAASAMPWYTGVPVKLAAGFVALAGGVLLGRSLMEGESARGPQFPGEEETASLDAGRRGRERARKDVEQAPSEPATASEASALGEQSSSGVQGEPDLAVAEERQAEKEKTKVLKALGGGNQEGRGHNAPQGKAAQQGSTQSDDFFLGTGPVEQEVATQGHVLFSSTGLEQGGSSVSPEAEGLAALGAIGYAGSDSLYVAPTSVELGRLAKAEAQPAPRDQAGQAPARKSRRQGPSAPPASGPGSAGPPKGGLAPGGGGGISPPASGPSSPGPPTGGHGSGGAFGGRQALASGGGGGSSSGASPAPAADPALQTYFKAGLEVQEDLGLHLYYDAGKEGAFGGWTDWGVGDSDVEGGAAALLTPAQIDELCEQRTTRVLQDCRRRPNERPRDMFFRFWGDNPFVLARLDTQSTFGVDVDTASYTLARRYLQGGDLPTKAQIRTEEFVNYFKPDLAPPAEGVFAIHTDLAPSRFGNAGDAPSQRWLLRVGVRGKEVAVEDRKPLALTFVVDTSGSMKEGRRLELVKHALRLLVAQMHGGDSISIVGFNNSASLVLPMTSAQNRGVIEAAIYGLQPGGGTNAEGGLKLGYEVAGAALTAGAHNRVVLLSDGVANVGQTDQDRINADVQRHRDAGIYLNTIGVGMNNHNDVFLEQLANKGDGICNYVDSESEARRALVENFTGAFEPIARDVKIQVEFDPGQVYRYRLLGYENRAIADADFRNDAVDAGEIGAGHQVVALYELEMTGGQTSEPLAQVRLRWKAPTGPGRDPLEDSAMEVEQPVSFAIATTWEGAELGYKRAAIVAQFAEILRRSVHARSDSLEQLIEEGVQLAAQMQDTDLVEFVTLLQTSKELILRHTPRDDDLANCIDSIRRNRILRAQYEELRKTENLAVIAELERVNQELEQRIRDLIREELEGSLR